MAKNLVRPIPTKQLPNTLLQPSSPPRCGCSRLDETVNYCFLQSIDLLSDPAKVQLALSFREFTERTHCEENLDFLIEIYKYEYYFEKVMSRSRAGSPQTITKTNSDHNVSTDFVATLEDDEFEFSPRIGPVPTPDSIPTSTSDDEEIDPHSALRLRELWRSIVDTYIRDDAPKQINVSHALYEEIISHSQPVNNPVVLRQARNEVLQNLKENVWPEYSKSTSPFSPSSKSVCSSHFESPLFSPKMAPPRSNSRARYNTDSTSSSVMSMSSIFGHFKRTSTSLPSSKSNSRSNSPISVDTTSQHSLKFWKRKH
ncbi:hypothetical protein DICA3_F19988 [Diutina catenulata]